MSAKDKGTGKEQRITITASSGLSQEEIEQMVNDAQEHGEEDRLKREEVQTRNTADNMAYTAENMLKDNADKVPDDLKSEIEGKITALRTALQGQDMALINSAMEELQGSLQRVGELVYSQTGGQGEGQGQPPEEGSDEEPPRRDGGGRVQRGVASPPTRSRRDTACPDTVGGTPGFLLWLPIHPTVGAFV